MRETGPEEHYTVNHIQAVD